MSNKAIYATAFALILLVLAGLMFAVFFMRNDETHERVTYNYYMARLKSLSGENAPACDEIDATIKAPVFATCITKAIQSNAPFHASVRIGRGGHSAWYGLARGMDGRLWQITFHNDLMGGWGSERHPSMHVLRCAKLMVPEPVTIPFECPKWR